MRALHGGLAAGLLLVMAAAVMTGGRSVVQRDSSVAVEPIAAEDLPDVMPPVDAPYDDLPAVVAEPARRSADYTKATPPARTIDPEITAPPALQGAPLERIAPRAPLSTLSLATPPDPVDPADLTGGPLFRPVAKAAGVIEVKGQLLTISGIEVVRPDETCTDRAGKVWHCGARASTAFQGFMRGRALTCTEPDKGDGMQCRIGKRDIGKWLVENGWARALPASPYAEAGRKAQEAGKGVFGVAPNLSGLPSASPLPADLSAPASDDPILDLSGTAAMPPVGSETKPLPGFPPAPGE
ncbi:thermonuclease family protein [Manganibacter manganicus]|uniref:TNase-like domain-containing protein n=1 Tax=Manganibacter manganicus TaxID=1873176 RepID=A0A1V8RKE0_9HYPH|nr:thermonuclease family protein [Pseudaminobacter manganicus]OQM73670.1 hypothetical protein BFN67_07060 [Pseudaminobacter manganicus]